MSLMTDDQESGFDLIEAKVRAVDLDDVLAWRGDVNKRVKYNCVWLHASAGLKRHHCSEDTFHITFLYTPPFETALRPVQQWVCIEVLR
jgi:hypothetical protein